MKKIHFFLIFSLFLHSVRSQDTVKISEVEVKAKRIETFGFKHTSISRKQIQLVPSTDIAQVLQTFSSIGINTYGKGGIASSSIRGGSASNTQVAWNGITINSPMLGQFNLALLPSLAFDRLDIVHGGNSLVQNSGALGGTILLQNAPHWQEQTKLSLVQKAGSLSNFDSNVRFLFTRENLQSNTFINFSLLRSSEDYKDYRFTAYDRQFFNQNFFRRGQNSILSAFLSYTQNNQTLPSNITNNEQIFQKLYLISLRWKYYSANHTIEATSGTFYNPYVYQNKIADIYSVNNTFSVQNKVNYTMQIQKFTLACYLADTRNFIETNNYSTLPHENYQYAEVAVNKDFGKKLKFYISNKKGLYNGVLLPYQPSVGINWSVNRAQNLHAKFSAAKNYRLPTLNDKYWVPGGNPKLQPEQGYSFDAGIEYEKEKLSSELTVFYSLLNNRIVWQPLNGNIWQAVNYDKVRSQGIEWQIHTKYRLANVLWNNDFLYSYVQAMRLYSGIKEQMPFNVPHRLSVVSYFTIKKWSAGATYNFQSKRYLNQSNSLPAIHLLNAQIKREISVKTMQIHLFLGVNNILNEYKENMPGYLVEPLNFNISLRIFYVR